MPVSVHIQRICTGHRGERFHLAALKAETALIDEKRRRIGTTGGKHFGQPIIVAIKNCNATAHEMLPTTGIDVICNLVRSVFEQRGRTGPLPQNRKGQRQRPHAARASPPIRCAVISDSASAEAPRAQTRSSQALIATLQGLRPSFSVSLPIACINSVA